MKLKINWWLLIIVILALFLRLYKLGELPYGFHVDEAKAGWNAYSVLKTGKDDWGKTIGMYYNSFGDFRPSAVIYSNIPSIFVFGKNIFAVRFPAALLGALTVIPIFLIVKLISKNEKWGLAAAGLMAISPWHLMVSRATSEVVMALFFSLLGLYFLLKRKVIPSVLFWVISFWFYHSIRVLAPLFILATIFFYWKEKSKKLWMILGIVVLMSGGLFIGKEARGRLSQVSIKSDAKITLESVNMPNQEGPGQVLVARAFHNKLVVLGRRMVEEYTNYFSTNFLVGSSAKPDRYMTQNFGLITYIELILLVLGIVALGKYSGARWAMFLLLLAPLPAAMTIEDVPNLHRSLWMIPFIVIIETYGLIILWEIKKYLVMVAILFLTINWIYFGHMYVVHQKFAMAAYTRDGGMESLVATIDKLQNNYDKIVVTNYPDGIYPWLGFLGNRDPNLLNSQAKNRINGDWQFENLEMVNEKCPTNWAFAKFASVKRLLVVNGEGCEIDQAIIKKENLKLVEVIKRPDLSPPFKLWGRVIE